MKVDLSILPRSRQAGFAVTGSMRKARCADIAVFALRSLDTSTGISKSPPGTTTTTNPSSINHGDSSIRREQSVKVRSMGFANNSFDSIVSIPQDAQHRPSGRDDVGQRPGRFVSVYASGQPLALLTPHHPNSPGDLSRDANGGPASAFPACGR